METSEESEDCSTIESDSEHTDPENEHENPDDLLKEMKQKILTNYLKE